jgi:hypothetical protein
LRVQSPPLPNAETGSSSCSGAVPQSAAGPESAGRASRRQEVRRGIDYAALRRQVSMADVLELVKFSPVHRGGSQVRGPCPVHRSSRENSRIFSANLEKHTYQCFKRSCGSKGNQLDLYVAVTGLPIYEAACDLCEKLGIEVPRRRGVN